MMLKLTRRFCRYTRVSYENLSSQPFSANVKRFTHLSCRRKTSVILNFHNAIDPFIHNNPQHTLVSVRRESKGKMAEGRSGSGEKSPEPQNSSCLISSFNLAYGLSEVSDDMSSSGWEELYIRSGPPVVRPPASSPAPKRPRRRQRKPDILVWDRVSRTGHARGTFTFKVVSYNVLAQCLIERHPELYTHCNPEHLKWPVRAAKLYEEIVTMDPDILCLQEVQAQHVVGFFSKLEHLGYFGVYKQKTGDNQDCCAIFFKTDVFQMKDHATVEFNQPMVHIMNRDNVALLVKLCPHAKEHGSAPIVVATTHLLYNPRRTDVRLSQMQLLLAEIDRFAYDEYYYKRGAAPIILTGDFNSTRSSPIIELLEQGRVDASAYLTHDKSDWRNIMVTRNCQHLNVMLQRMRGRPTPMSLAKHCSLDFRRNLPTAEPLELPPEVANYEKSFNKTVLTHSMNFLPVYSGKTARGENEASTYQNGWVSVDYMYYSYGLVRPLERLRLPSCRRCAAMGRVPNAKHPSDHFPVGAVFEFMYSSTLFPRSSFRSLK